MRYAAILFLVSVSLFSAEDLPLAVSVASGEQVSFVMPDFNQGRGDGTYRVRHILATNFGNNTVACNADNTNALQRLVNGVVVESFTYGIGAPWATYVAYNNGLAKPLFADNPTMFILEEPQRGQFTFFNHVSNLSGPNPNPAFFLTGPTGIYTAPRGFVGADQVRFVYRDPGFNLLATVTVSITVTNRPPTASASASPLLIAPGDAVGFACTASDPDGHGLTFAWDFGDGSSSAGSNPSHVYAAAGTYSATVTVNDGFDSVQSSVRVVVAGADRLPVPRFLTDDVSALVGVPFVFDATPSTDPQNALVAYEWDFGDGTPVGAGKTITKAYAAAGTVTVRLTVTDGEGLRQTLAREIDVLAENAPEAFTGEVTVVSTFFPTKENRDTLNVFARVNIGDRTLSEGSAVALEFAGARYAATLDKRGRAAGWAVKQNLRRLPIGTVEVSFKARRAALAALLATAGAVDGELVEVPFKLELGGKTIEVPVETEFEINALNTRGKASGEL